MRAAGTPVHIGKRRPTFAPLPDTTVQDNLPFILKGNVFPDATRIMIRPGIEKKMFADTYLLHVAACDFCSEDQQ